MWDHRCRVRLLIVYTPVLLLMIFTLGCRSYSPKPLTSKDVETALKPPPPAELRVEAASLKHPILNPITLNPKDGLSPDEAAVMAVLLNPGLKAVRDKRGLADAQVLSAGILPNPQLDVSLEQPLAGAVKGSTLGIGAGLSWDFSALIARKANIASAKAARNAVDLEIAYEEWQVAQSARLAVLNLMGLRQQVVEMTAINRNLSENLAAIRTADQKGLVTELEVAAAETASLQASAELAQLQQEEHRQLFALNRLLGRPVEAPVDLQQNAELPEQLLLPTSIQLEKGLEARRLDLAALRYGYESQEQALRAAVLGQFPKFSLGLTGGRDTGDLVTAGVGVSADLPLFDRHQGAVAVETATRRQLFDEYVSRLFEARADITENLDEVRCLNEQIALGKTDIDSRQRLLDTYRAALDKGEADILSYYEAFGKLSEKKRSLIALKMKLIEAALAVEIAAGVYGMDTLRQLADTPVTSSENR